jgi:hypothetical protein
MIVLLLDMEYLEIQVFYNIYEINNTKILIICYKKVNKFQIGLNMS